MKNIQFLLIATIFLIGSLNRISAEPFAYVANNDDGTVSVIDTVTNIVVDTIPVGTDPFGVAVTPDATKVYVTNSMSDDVSVIDAATNTVLPTIPVGTFPLCLAITPDGTNTYVANSSSHNISIINTTIPLESTLRMQTSNMQENKLRVLIADDELILREGLKKIVEQNKSIEVVGCVKNGLEAIEAFERLKPDVILMDLFMPEYDGIESTKIIKTKNIPVKIIILTSYNGYEHMTRAYNNGADGYYETVSKFV